MTVTAVRPKRPRLAAGRGGRARRLALAWLAFLLVLLALAAGAAEGGLRLRREWVAARLPEPAVDDQRFVGDRLLQLRNRPGYSFASPGPSGQLRRYTNNSLGLRGAEVARPKPAGLLRVVVVGGSTVYGALVDDADTLPVHLQHVLAAELGRPVEVLNAGVPGYEALREAVYTKADLLDLQPDVVVDLDGLNDVFYGTLEEWPTQIAGDELGIIGDGRFPEVVAAIDSTMFPYGLLEHQLTTLPRTVRLGLARLRSERPPTAPRAVSPRVVALYAESLRLLAGYGRERGVPVIVGLQPLLATGHKTLTADEQAAVGREGYWTVDGWPALAGAMYAQMAARTRPAVEAAGGRWLDLTAVFDAEPGSVYAEDAVHYTALGNQRLAEVLAPAVLAALGNGQQPGSSPR